MNYSEIQCKNGNENMLHISMKTNNANKIVNKIANQIAD